MWLIRKSRKLERNHLSAEDVLNVITEAIGFELDIQWGQPYKIVVSHVTNGGEMTSMLTINVGADSVMITDATGLVVFEAVKAEMKPSRLRA